jgi:putative DNA primase/helicase
VFTGQNCDPHLRAKLELELSGILLWALEGLARWMARGCKFDRPEEVNANIKKYRHEQDTLQHFIDECCAVGNGEEAQSSRFTTALRKWADENGEFRMGAKEIKSRMEAKGFTLKPRSAGNFWQGITVVSRYDPVSVDDLKLSDQYDPHDVM